MTEPKLVHAVQLLHLLRYALHSKSSNLTYGHRPQRHSAYPRLEVYTDSSFAEGNDQKRNSRTGVLVTLDGCPIHWKSKRQSLTKNGVKHDITAISTFEAELIALGAGLAEALFYRGLLEEFGYKQPSPTPIYVDNSSVVDAVYSEYQNSAHRHIDVRYWRIKDHIAFKDVVVAWIPGEINPADLLTKILPPALNQTHTDHVLTGTPYPDNPNRKTKAPNQKGRGSRKGPLKLTNDAKLLKPDDMRLRTEPLRTKNVSFAPDS